MQERISESMAYRVPVKTSTSRGRPRFTISQDQFEYLMTLSFTWTDISCLLGVSRMTIFRRQVEFQMLTESSRTIASDSELRIVLASIR